MTAVDVRVARADELDACRAVRRAVFVVGQGVPEHLEVDGRDADCGHIIAVDASGRAVGTARLMPGPGAATCQRVAVLEGLRGTGLGARIMAVFEREARRRGHSRVTLHAQASVVGFYERLGYTAHGEPFMEAGIEHRHMDKVL